jgi:hypothetical protein
MTTRAVRLIAVLLAVTACNRPASGGAAVDIDAPNSWIDRPLEGTRLLAGGTLPIVWHASGDDGIRRVEILIDGEAFEEVDDLDPDLTLAQGETEWTAAGAGEHLIQVVATGPDEVVGPPAARKVMVFAEGGSLIVAAYSDLNEDGDAEDAGEGPLEGVQLVVGQCWSESFATTGPDGLAGYSGLPMEECLLNFLYPGWVFSGTIPAGLDLPIHFTPDPAEDIVFTLLFTQPPTPKPNPTATLAFATTIPVFPVVTAIPPVDDVPPPKPQIISPDGEVVACLEDVVLRWGEVSDPSGIEYYEIVLRVNTGGADFTTVATWQVESFTALDVSDQTDCGSTYGWLVRARDNAGNWSANDGAFFGIDLP